MTLSNAVFDLKWAQTLDGQLCDDSHTSKWISSEAERIETHRIRSLYDAVLVGASTFINDKAQLTVRHGLDLAPRDQPVRIILDPRGRLATHLETHAESANDVMLELCDNRLRPTLVLAPEHEILSKISSKTESSLQVSCFDADFGDANFWEKLREALKKGASSLDRRFNEILVEGGPQVLSAFLGNGEYRRAIVSLSPKVTGGNRHRISIHRHLSEAQTHRLVDTQIFGTDVLLTLEKIESTSCEISPTLERNLHL